jgi:glycosyltransferase involved in cell wall biosynthesis
MHIIVDGTTTQNQLKYNGVGQYTKHILEGILNTKELDLTLILFEGESTLDSLLKKATANVKIIRIGKLRKSDYLNPIWYLTKILPAILKNKKENSVYFCPYFWQGIPSLWIPTVLMVHDFTLPKFNIYSEQGPIKNIIKGILYWLEMFKARFCKAIITNAKYTAKDFEHYFPRYNRENIYPILLDGKLDKPTIGWNINLPKDYEQRGYFIYLGGTLYKNKNSDGVIKGYRDFLNKIHNPKDSPYLVIAGKNFTKEIDPNVKIFKDKISNLGIKDKVVFVGFYEDSHAKELLSNSLALVHLSLYEGFGLTLVEAMNAGTPVIAHNGSCYPEVVEDAGLLVDGLNPKEVAEAMYSIYSDSDLRESLIGKGSKRAKDFSWEKASNETLDVLKSIVPVNN